jgi:quercetin dioxygenase-like cupin family protein
METSQLSYPTGTKDDFLKELFKYKESDFKLQFGTAFLKKGTRIPFKGGYTRHDENKIVCILEGEIKLKLEANKTKNIILKSGDIFKVKKLEGHSGLVLEDAKLIYIMFGKEVFPEL